MTRPPRQQTLPPVGWLAAVTAATAFSACRAGDQDKAPDPTALPDLTGVETPVAKLIRARHEQVQRSPTATNLGAYGRVLHTHGMLRPAVRAYLAALDLSSATEQFEYLYLAAVAVSATDPSRAIDMLHSATRLRPKYVAAYLLMGRLLESLGRLDDARDCYATAIEASRTSATSEVSPSSHALLGLGRVILAQGDALAALGHLQRAQRSAPQHREVYEALARCYARLGQTTESRSAARRAGDLARPTPYHDELQLKLGNENVSSEVRSARGASFARAGRSADAIREFLGVLEARPDHLEAHDYLALLYEKTQPRQALQHLDTILRLNPRYARGLELRARILLRLEQRARARVDLRALLRVDPKHAWARQQLGR